MGMMGKNMETTTWGDVTMIGMLAAAATIIGMNAAAGPRKRSRENAAGAPLASTAIAVAVSALLFVYE